MNCVLGNPKTYASGFPETDLLPPLRSLREGGTGVAGRHRSSEARSMAGHALRFSFSSVTDSDLNFSGVRQSWATAVCRARAFRTCHAYFSVPFRSWNRD